MTKRDLTRLKREKARQEADFAQRTQSAHEALLRSLRRRGSSDRRHRPHLLSGAPQDR
ncbi:MAG: hypothetical protein ACXVY8_01455 [Gaiellaceae bacterium]